MFEGHLGDKDADKQLNLMYLATLWRKASTISSEQDKRRARLEEDPDRIPEIQAQQYACMREAFVNKHRDFILTETREPHNKFIERLLRDYSVHSIVPYYPLGDVRLRSESIKVKKSFQTTGEFLLRVAHSEESSTVNNE
eukprot:645976-Amphidinium_carterae.1